MTNGRKIAIGIGAVMLMVAITYFIGKRKDSFAKHFLANRWGADYGKEGAPIMDAITYKNYVRSILPDGVVSTVGDIGRINVTGDTIFFDDVPTAWVLIKPVDNKFSRYFLANQWRADYGKEGAPLIDSTNYRTYVSAFRQGGLLSGSGDVGEINATEDTIHFKAVPSAWVLIKKAGE